MSGTQMPSGSRSRQRRIVSIIALLAILVATGGPLVTLCLGDDGHLAVEQTVAGRCTPDDVAVDPPSATNRAFAGLDGQDPCCGPCTDLPGPLEQCIGRGGAFELEHTPTLFLAASTIFPCLSDRDAAAHRPAAALTSPRKHPAPSTTILLC